MGVCNCSMFCCTLLYVHSSIAIILTGKRELVSLLNLSSWCLVMVERLFLAVPRGCLRFVIVVFPDHTHLLLLYISKKKENHYTHWKGLDDPEHQDDIFRGNKRFLGNFVMFLQVYLCWTVYKICQWPKYKLMLYQELKKDWHSLV